MTVQEFVAKHPEVLYVSIAYVAKPIPDSNDEVVLNTWEARLVADTFEMYPSYAEQPEVFCTGNSPEEAMDSLFTAYESK